MEENKNEKVEVNQTEEKKVIAPNLKEILDKVSKAKELTKEEIEILQKQAKESTEFMELIEKIQLPKDNYVIFTDGEEQLVYENGEFFIVSTIDSTKAKKKKKRLEAKDMYIEYFIRYTLNKINPKQVDSIEKSKSEPKKVKEEKAKTEKVEKEEIKKEKQTDEKRAEEIKESLKNMVTPVEDYERTKIIDKIKKGNEKSEKVR